MNGGKAIVSDINYCVRAAPAQAAVTTTVAAGPTPLAAAPTYFRRATILGCKALAGTPNVGNVQLGYAAAAGQQPYLIAPSDTVTLEAPVGAKYSLSDVYITVLNDNDGVVIIYA